MGLDDNFAKLFKITNELLQVKDIDVLLERMLTEVRSIVGTDAGSIYLVEGKFLRFSHTQNNTLQKKLPFGKKMVYSRLTVSIDNKSIAGYVANAGVLINIPNAYELDGYQSYNFDRSFDEATGYRSQSILTVPIVTTTGRIVGVIQLINAINANGAIRSFNATDETVVQMFANNVSVAIAHAQMVRSVILKMNRLVQFYDPAETVGHVNRVASYAAEIYEFWANRKGIPAREEKYNRDVLRIAAMFCNIGKICLPKEAFGEILSLEATKIREKHTVYGAQLFNDVYSDFEEMARSIALNHHEHWDGSGYPGHVNLDAGGTPKAGYAKPDGSAFGKRGEEIPIYARIVSVAKAYDRLTYKFGNDGVEMFLGDVAKGLAVEKIKSGSGTTFDPDVVMAFMNCLESIDSISGDYHK